MTTITIVKEINCNGLTCGKCGYSQVIGRNPKVLCKLFGRELTMTREGGTMRCKECLEGEKCKINP
jgi:hypothetical protein